MPSIHTNHRALLSNMSVDRGYIFQLKLPTGTCRLHSQAKVEFLPGI